MEDSINGDQIKQNENRNIYGYNGSYEIKNHVNESVSLISKFGLGLRFDDISNNELSHTVNRNTTLNYLALGDLNEANLNFYADEVLKLGNHWRINAGLRYDIFEFEYQNDLDSLYDRQAVTKNIVSPKLNFYYVLNKNVELYLKTGTGFHSNDSRVVVVQNGLGALPKAYGADLGLNWKPFGRLYLNPAVWILHLDQEFVYVGDAGIVEPSGRTRRYGVDLSARYQIINWLFLDFDVNYTKAKSIDEENGEDHIPLAPTLTSIGGITIQHKSGINGSLRYRFLGDRSANEDYSITAQGYVIVDATLNYTKPKYEIGVSILNLLDERMERSSI